MLLKNTILSGALATAALATPATAITLTLDGGWTAFTFEEVGTSWSDQFTFTLATTAYFAVTDLFCAGDQFEFSVNGVVEGQTSTPFYDGTCFGPTFTDSEDTAFSSDDWSSGEIELSAGSYTITGTAIASPFGSGGAAAQLSSTSFGGPIIAPPGTVTPPTAVVPLPAGGVLLLSALGIVAAARRKLA